MSDQKMTVRDKVAAEIEKGTMTKAAIAEELGISPGSVSSQMTYLRWMGKFIKTDADKVLSFVDEDTYNAWQEEVKASRTTRSASSKTPEEQAIAVHKTLDRQNKQLASWEKKLNTTELALEDEPNDEALLEFLEEIKANITLLKIKIRRNTEKAEALPEVEEVPEEREEGFMTHEDEDEDEDKDLL